MKNIFAIYKSKGPTSNGALEELRRITGIRKIGHAGTLDPFATGLLLVAVGRESTKVIGKKMVKVLTWYDNETGFSHRMVDVAKIILKNL